MKEETKKVLHFSTEVKLNTIFTIFKNCNYSNVFDFSTDAKVRRFLDRFMNEACTTKYAKTKEQYRDAQQTYKLYTAENLLAFIVNPEIINFIQNSEKFNDIRISFSKKFLKTLKDDAWKAIEYIPVVDEEAEMLASLEKEYKDFHSFKDFYKIRKYNPKATYKLDFPGLVVYDVTDQKNINKVWEYPANTTYKDTLTYIKMCKVHWVKSNEFNLSEKFKDARVMSTTKYEEMLNN